MAKPEPLTEKPSPFSHFLYCPRCAGAAITVSGRAVRCGDCGWVYFVNCATATAGVIVHQGKVLLGVRGKPPCLGMLDFPGGFVEFDETAEQALTREIREEFNLTVSDMAYLTSAPNDYFYKGVFYKTTDLYFICAVETVAGIRAMDDVAAYRWADPAALEPQELAFASGRVALRRYLETVR